MLSSGPNSAGSRIRWSWPPVSTGMTWLLSRFVPTWGVSVYCGSEEDPLDRYYQAARLFKASHVVRIKADCPLIDPKIIDDAISSHLTSGAGLFVEYRHQDLSRRPGCGDSDRRSSETGLAAGHPDVGPGTRYHLYREASRAVQLEPISGTIQICQRSGGPWTDLRTTWLIRFIYEHLYHRNPVFGMEETLEFLRHHKDMETINQHINIAEGVIISQSNDRTVEPDSN